MGDAAGGELAFEELDFLWVGGFPVFEDDESWAWAAMSSEVLVALVAEGGGWLLVDEEVVEVECGVVEDDVASESLDLCEEGGPTAVGAGGEGVEVVSEGLEACGLLGEWTEALDEGECALGEVEGVGGLVDDGGGLSDVRVELQMRSE